jgi:hypothetical protein
MVRVDPTSGRERINTYAIEDGGQRNQYDIRINRRHQYTERRIGERYPFVMWTNRPLGPGNTLRLTIRSLCHATLTPNSMLVLQKTYTECIS